MSPEFSVTRCADCRELLAAVDGQWIDPGGEKSCSANDNGLHNPVVRWVGDRTVVTPGPRAYRRLDTT